MSNKMFKTIYPVSVDNDNLPVIGELTFKFKKSTDSTPVAAKRCFTVQPAVGHNITVVGGYLTDSTLTENLGTTFIPSATEVSKTWYVSDGDVTVKVSNKYDINNVGYDMGEGSITDGKADCIADLTQLKYLSGLSIVNGAFITIENGDLSVFENKAMRILNLHHTSVSGDISSLKDLTSLTTVNLSTTSVSGDISLLKDLTSLTIVNLSTTSVSGDISSLKDLTSLTIVNLSTTSVSGDISSLKDLTSLTTVNLSTTSVSGDISSLSGLTNLVSLRVNGTKITGDLSSITNLTNLKILQISNGQFTNQDTAVATFTSNGCTITVV